jgi:hypothetical protein
MRFSDIPITGYRIEVDEYALGRFVLEKFLEQFGPEQILGADTNGGLLRKPLSEANIFRWWICRYYHSQ